ncbi:ABC transporter substrate-binding protein [Clostridia bacterium]|nr:ABC transporter substrate-binding protein [Clostridia bacterium]
MKMKRFAAILTALLMLTFVMAACANGNDASSSPSGNPSANTSSNTDPNTDPSEGEGGGDEAPLNLTINVASEPQTIDPVLNSSVDGAIYSHHFFEGLIRWADDGAGNAVLVPGQAESWDQVTNADGTVTYTFHLRDGIKWSDGKTVVAEDFAYGLRRLVTPETAADYNYIVDGIIVGATEALEGAAAPDTIAVSATDDKTLVITTVNECPYFTELLAFPPLFPARKDIIDANGDQWTFSPATYVTNGPYKMVEWEHNSYILSEKNPEYYDYAKLGPATIKWALMDDANAMLTGFQNGELDFIEDMPVDEIPALKDSGKLTVVPYIGTYYASFNTQVAPFDNAKVRRAFTLAIDRDNIVDNITRTGQIPASAFVPSGIGDAPGVSADFRATGGDWYSVAASDYEANCEEARRLLAEAGYPNGEGFPVVEYLYNTSANHKAIAEALQADWQRELGVTITINNQDWGVFLETRKKGDYVIARDAWIADFNDPISFIDMFVTGGGNNNSQYKSPAFDALVAASRAATDPAERFRILHEAEALMQSDNILAPIYFYTQKYMLNPNVQGLYYTPLGYFLFDRCTLK